MIEHFQAFLTDAFGATTQVPQLTLIFDTGNNSKDNFGLIDTLKLPYAGSIKLSAVKALAEISNQHGPGLLVKLSDEKRQSVSVSHRISTARQEPLWSHIMPIYFRRSILLCKMTLLRR